MDLELEPEQPAEVAAAVAALLGVLGAGEPDPWWQAGVDDGGDGA